MGCFVLEFLGLGLDYMLFILVVKIVIVLKEECVFDEEFLVILIKN